MKMLPTLLGAAAVALLALVGAQTAAFAANLIVTNVNAPAVNCVFDASCTIVVNDSSGSLAFTELGGGAFFQSRTYVAKPGTPGAGNTAYLYRLDLRQATTFQDCMVGAVINFGPVSKLTYPPNTPAHVFVITTGGLGSVGIKSAEQDGDVITFTFDKYLCPGATSFFFGMAAVKPPQAHPATLFGISQPAFIQVDARVPQH